MSKENKKEQPIDDYSLDMDAKRYLKKLLNQGSYSPEYILAVSELYKAIYRKWAI